MPVDIINASFEYSEKVEKIRPIIRDIADKLSLNRPFTSPVTFVFIDHDPVYEGVYKGGGNYYGKMHDVVLIWVWDDKHQSFEALCNLVAHEARHVFQSFYDVTFPEQKIKDNEEYSEKHDELPIIESKSARKLHTQQ